MDTKYRVFISYAHEDTALLQKVVAALDERKLLAILTDSTHIRLAEPTHRQIEALIKLADCVVVLFTHTSVKSVEVNKEIAIAATMRKPIVPVIFDNVDNTPKFPAELHDIQSIHATSDNIEASILSIVKYLERDAFGEAILVVGSGVKERVFTDTSVFQVQGRVIIIKSDGKQIIQRPLVHYGGSGVNFSMRLAKTGHQILPILSIGGDPIGKEIRELILESIDRQACKPSVLEFIKGENFFCKGLESAEVPVFSTGRVRIALTPLTEGTEKFDHFVTTRLSQIPVSVGAVLIGHIYADAYEHCHMAITRRILDDYADKALIFANFGKSQLNFGFKSWEHDLQRKISILQLSYEEARLFFSFGNLHLQEIISWFWERRISVVITLDVMGVIAVYGGDASTTKVLYGEAYRLPQSKMKDPTGAGDAFAAGMVATLFGDMSFTCKQFRKAIDVGRIWGAFACTVVGSSIGSPTQCELEEFLEPERLKTLEDYTRPDDPRLLDHIELVEKIYE